MLLLHTQILYDFDREILYTGKLSTTLNSECTKYMKADFMIKTLVCHNFVMAYKSLNHQV